MKSVKFLFAAATLAAVSASTLTAAETNIIGRKVSSPSALKLVEEGNRYIGEQAKDKVVQIRSERSSEGTLNPAVWYVVYYDSTAALKATEVKFSNGKMVDVKRPMRLLEATGHKKDPLPKDKLKIDSDEALKIATSQPGLDKDITLKSSEMRLEHGPADEPVWRVQLWATGPGESKYETSIGDVIMSATDGKVIEMNLKPDKVR